jgi:hypothetical protein
LGLERAASARVDREFIPCVGDIFSWSSIMEMSVKVSGQATTIEHPKN